MPHKRGKGQGASEKPKAPHITALTPIAGIQISIPLRISSSAGAGLGCRLSFSAAGPPDPSSAGLDTGLSPHCTKKHAGREAAGLSRRPREAGIQSPALSDAVLVVFTGGSQPWAITTGP